MTPRSIRRAAERKARKQQERKARLPIAATAHPADIAIQAPLALEDSLDFAAPALSPAKLQANRANAQLSTGPTSTEGRNKVSLNAVKTALTGRTVLLPDDDAADYQRHVQAFAAQYGPVGPREADLVQSIADTWWRLKRIPCLESALLAQGYIEFADSFDDHDAAIRPGLIQAHAFLKYEKQIRNLQLQEARLFRRYEKDRAELLALQQARQQQELAAFEHAALEQAALEQAALAQLPGKQVPGLSEVGFEFSNAEMEHQFAALDAPESAAAAAQTYLKATAQAA